eukprot:6044247-Amphidinium_carterae.1
MNGELRRVQVVSMRVVPSGTRNRSPNHHQCSNVRCAVGFSGDVIATCVPVDGVECEFVQNYTGCQRTQPCKLPDVIDVCQHNFSACSDLQVWPSALQGTWGSMTGSGMS